MRVFITEIKERIKPLKEPKEIKEPIPNLQEKKIMNVDKFSSYIRGWKD
jgi:hypothetical protein